MMCKGRNLCKCETQDGNHTKIFVNMWPCPNHPNHNQHACYCMEPFRGRRTAERRPLFDQKRLACLPGHSRYSDIRSFKIKLMILGTKQRAFLSICRHCPLCRAASVEVRVETGAWSQVLAEITQMCVHNVV